MKQLLITVAVVMLVGCGTTKLQEITPKVETPDTSIHKVAYIRDIESVRQDLAAGTDPSLNIAALNSPLLYAVGYEIMILLVEYGEDVNELGSGITALHWYTDPESVGYLEDKVADVNAAENFGNTPLHKVVEGFCLREKEIG